MTDVAIQTSKKGEWNLDLDIVNGEPIYLSEESNNIEQRAALASYTVLGSIPSMLTVGVDWGSYFDKDKNIIAIDNQIQQSIRNLVNTTDQYLPMYMQDEDGNLQLLIARSGL